MYYYVAEELFDKLPTACFGAVFVQGIDNRGTIPEISEMLDEQIAYCESIMSGVSVKQSDFILPYREAFRAFGINPNKYMCSIEALMTRISKGKGMPSINPAVDLGNAISLKYIIPIGAHDVATFVDGGLEVRRAVPEDTFIPFGGEGCETPDADEIIYASGNTVRTRRWTWRQSEIGKITDKTTDIFFPIDGFSDFNKKSVESAIELFEDTLHRMFNCTVKTGIVDRNNPKIIL